MLESLDFENKRLEKKEIAKFLLDQDKFSGIGNYLRAEILYDSKIDPFRKVGSLSKKEIDNLFKSTKKIVLKAYECGGHTLQSYTDPLGAIGRYAPKVYRREKDPEGRIVQIDLTSDNRAIYWVPEIQK